ncbi:type II toxin-antitoxin system VapC family toxin [Candidatus Gottesmanbacteria bacterium]|nr:type II toxin-antitoxin system VapC family toxin [Candidatus Gottesmanbacteria bacterium]
MIFVDSDTFIGIIAPQDAHHTRATRIFDRFSKTQEEFVTSWETIDEVATKLSKYFGKDIARTFFHFLAHTQITVVYVDKILAGVATTIFDQQTSKNISLTDCANIAICRSLGITTMFSFDLHYKKNGLKLLS